ncbi:MAG TPA: mRNA-degrading endonuclease [Anaerolineae bacterium]|nr:mRNA-degrading endonuclease [Anaerolineae bacterium]
MAQYIPKQGDYVALTFDPQAGHEQKGRRPALVISKHAFNRATKMAIVCPLTNTNRQIPFHVAVAANSTLTGFVMVEQIKAIDYRSRKMKFIEKAAVTTVDEVLARLDACIY